MNRTAAFQAASRLGFPCLSPAPTAVHSSRRALCWSAEGVGSFGLWVIRPSFEWSPTPCAAGDYGSTGERDTWHCHCLLSLVASPMWRVAGSPSLLPSYPRLGSPLLHPSAGLHVPGSPPAVIRPVGRFGCRQRFGSGIIPSHASAYRLPARLTPLLCASPYRRVLRGLQTFRGQACSPSSDGFLCSWLVFGGFHPSEPRRAAFVRERHAACPGAPKWALCRALRGCKALRCAACQVSRHRAIRNFGRNSRTYARFSLPNSAPEQTKSLLRARFSPPAGVYTTARLDAKLHAVAQKSGRTPRKCAELHAIAPSFALSSLRRQPISALFTAS